MTTPVIEVSRSVGDRERAGFSLYQRLISFAFDGDYAERSAYWFTSANPAGPGALASAVSAGGEVVGFYTVIPMLMRIGGQTRRGGKGEFFAVEREAAREVDPETGKRLPQALIDRGRAAMFEGGAEVTFGNPGRAALMMARLTSAVALSVETTTLRIPLRVRSARGLRDAAKGLAARAVARRRLRPAAAAELGGRPVAVEPVDRFDDSLEIAEQPNATFVGIADQLNFRFPSPWYHKLVVTAGGQPIGQLAMTEPRLGQDVSLRYWSSAPALQSGVGPAIAWAWRRAVRQGATGFTLACPRTVADELTPGARSVFGSTSTAVRPMMVHSPDGAVLEAARDGGWWLTAAHQGLDKWL